MDVVARFLTHLAEVYEAGAKHAEGLSLINDRWQDAEILRAQAKKARQIANDIDDGKYTLAEW